MKLLEIFEINSYNEKSLFLNYFSVMSSPKIRGEKFIFPTILI